MKQELQQDEKVRKAALHALIERIKAYPDRKMKVKFRIGERNEGTSGGQTLAPHLSTVNTFGAGRLQLSAYLAV